MAASLFTRRHITVKTGAELPVLCINVAGLADGAFESGAGQTLWTCPAGCTYRLHSMTEVHDVPTGTASAHSLIPERLQGTEAPGAGDDLGSGFNLLGADDTVLSTTLVASTADGTFDFVGGDRLAYNCTVTGSPDSTAGVCLTAILVPVHRSRYAV
jgi:hypothetical protein